MLRFSFESVCDRSSINRDGVRTGFQSASRSWHILGIFRVLSNFSRKIRLTIYLLFSHAVFDVPGRPPMLNPREYTA